VWHPAAPRASGTGDGDPLLAARTISDLRLLYAGVSDGNTDSVMRQVQRRVCTAQFVDHYTAAVDALEEDLPHVVAVDKQFCVHGGGMALCRWIHEQRTAGTLSKSLRLVYISDEGECVIPGMLPSCWAVQ
jgi:hypothetical protein